jgi:signal transduction histidine kinase
MRVAPAATGALFLLSLLAWLSSLDQNSPHIDRELQALDDFARSERGLGREVLAARAGLSRNYDALVRFADVCDQSLDRLREVANEGPSERAAFELLAAGENKQQALIEEFKSKNAVLQNSFAYFGLFSSHLAASSHPSVAAAGTKLAASMLHLTLDTSQDNAREVQDGLDQLAALKNLADEGPSIEAVIAHGGMLRELLPATDSIVKAFMVTPTWQEQDLLRSLILGRQRAAQGSAHLYGLLLYATSLALVAVLVYLGLQLRNRAVALRRRAAFEHLIAGISMRFINMAPGKVASHVEWSLERLADCIGADRAYFVVPAAPPQIYKWARENVEFPLGWAENVLDLIGRLEIGSEGIIHLPKISSSHQLDPQNVLANAGLRGWLCVAGRYGRSTKMVLGFDSLRSGTLTQHAEFSLYRMAFDAIANGLVREMHEREKERLHASLQQARRMETVGALASGVAHNFNNIIGAILGYAEMAGAQLSSGNRPANHLHEISRAGERARELISQILTLGRREGARQRLNIKALLSETSGLLKASLPSHVGISVDATVDDVMVMAEPARLQQVIVNICNNAAQAMEEPGTIDIKIETRVTQRPVRIRGSTIDPGRFVVVSIADPGCGMDESTLSRIFEPFYTTKPDGNGLGLSTVRQTIVEYGGAMEVSSVVGEGTRFDVWLPSIPANEANNIIRPSKLVARGNGETVLVLQADRMRVLRDEEILAALGYEPLGFSEHAEALAACRAKPQRYDAVLICQHSGSRDALDFAIAVDDIAPNLPVILAAPSSRELDASVLVTSGISELIHYPLDSSELRDALAHCLTS